MNKELQDLSWACLPKETRDKMAEYYRTLLSQKDEYISLNFGNACAKVKERMAVLEHFFGPHNLTSDTDPEEMLMVERKKVQEIYHQVKLELGDGGCSEYQDDINMERESLLKTFFGDKCLPDKMNVPSSGGGMNTTPPSYKLDVKKEPISARIAVPTVYGHLEHEPTKHLISVYSKIGWFKRLMLRWCFGLRYVKHDNRTR